MKFYFMVNILVVVDDGDIKDFPLPLLRKKYYFNIFKKKKKYPLFCVFPLLMENSGKF